MFVRAQKSGKRTYLLIVENEWAGGKVRQKVLHRLGRLDILQQTGKLDALMLSMHINHPDILEFISCKNSPEDVTNFNISVAVIDAFMEALEKGC